MHLGHPSSAVVLISPGTWATRLVGVDGLPKEVHVRRGLGFGLDKKAEVAVWQYRFMPATKKGRPIADQRDVMVEFAKF